MKALGRLTRKPKHVQMLLRPVYVSVWVAYGFGDAYREGFSDKHKPLNIVLSIHIDFWCTLDSEKCLKTESIAT